MTDKPDAPPSRLSTILNRQLGPGPGRVASRGAAVRLIRTLAWGAGIGIPLHQAVRAAIALTPREARFHGKPSDSTAISGSHGWTLPAGFTEYANDLAGDLERGLPLSQALDQHWGRRLPPYVIPAIREAEATNSLPATLGMLADRLERHAEANLFAKFALTEALGILFGCSLAVLGVLIFVVPRYSKLMYEMGVQPAGTYWYFAFACWLVSPPGRSLAFLFVLTIVLGALAARFILRITWLDLLAGIPWLGRLVNLWYLHEVASCFAAALASGLDLPHAARFARQSIDSPSLRRRLDHLADCLARGAPWPDAWASLRLGGSLERWLIVDGATRDDTPGAMLRICDHARQRLDRAGTRINDLAPYLHVLILGPFVALTSTGVYGVLMQILHHLETTY